MSELYYSAGNLENCPIAFKFFNLVSQSLRKINTFVSSKEVFSFIRLIIKKMKSGEVLKIIVDYPLSAERIPETMKSLGHEVISAEKEGTAAWAILIKVK